MRSDREWLFGLLTLLLTAVFTCLLIMLYSNSCSTALSISIPVLMMLAVLTVISLAAVAEAGKSKARLGSLVLFASLAVTNKALIINSIIRRRGDISDNYDHFIRKRMVSCGYEMHDIHSYYLILHSLMVLFAVLSFAALLKNKDNILGRLHLYTPNSRVKTIAAYVGFPGYHKLKAWLLCLIKFEYWKRPHVDWLLMFFCWNTFLFLSFTLADIAHAMDISGINTKTFRHYLIISVFTAWVGYFIWLSREMRRAVVLHLSDIHITDTEQATLWFGQLRDDLERDLQCSQIDWMIISGDITQQAAASEFSAAKLLIDKICSRYGIHRDRLVIVPGNHDVDWSSSRNSYKNSSLTADDIKKMEDKGDKRREHYIVHMDTTVSERDEIEYKNRFLNFSQFFLDCTGKEYSLEYHKQYSVAHDSFAKLVFVGLNSAWKIDHHYRDRASINSLALEHSISDLEAIADDIDDSNWCKIAICHHPFNSEQEDRIKNADFMQRLSVSGFRIFLHGHIHKAETGIYQYDIVTDPENEDEHNTQRCISVMSAGTFGAPTREWVPGYPLQYSLIQISRNGVTVNTRCREKAEGAWRPDARWGSGPGSSRLSYYWIPL